MAMVRYATAIDIHPAAHISSEGILIDHGVGLVVGADAVIGGGVTLYHAVTLGASGKRVSVCMKVIKTQSERFEIFGRGGGLCPKDKARRLVPMRCSSRPTITHWPLFCVRLRVFSRQPWVTGSDSSSGFSLIEGGSTPIHPYTVCLPNAL